MSKSMIERISNVIKADVNEWASNLGDAYLKPEHCRAIARAVLTAMREPTESMMAAGVIESSNWMEDDCRECWQAMIDAALEGK